MVQTDYQQNEIDQVCKQVSTSAIQIPPGISTEQPTQINTNSSPYKKIIIAAVTLVLIASVSFAGYYYFENYIQTKPEIKPEALLNKEEFTKQLGEDDYSLISKRNVTN